MNEAQWLPGTSPVGMLQSLRGKISDRKLRLFACACCRRVWDLLPDDANRNLVVAAENYPEAPSWPKSYDGLQEWARKYPELDDAMRASSAGEREWGAWDGNGSYWAVKYLGRGFYKLSPLESANTVSLKIALEVRPRSEKNAEFAAQADLLRDIVGNPYRSEPIDSAWLQWHEGIVVKFASSIYDNRDFGCLPVLADALEEAGCTNADILHHCRKPGEHVRGCWVVDLVLGKT